MAVIVECQGVKRRLRGTLRFSGDPRELRALADRLYEYTRAAPDPLDPVNWFAVQIAAHDYENPQCPDTVLDWREEA